MLWIKILSYFRGQYVGIDSYENRYYRKIRTKTSPEKRWVLYKNKAESSHIPAPWHGWIHFTFNEIPSDLSSEKQKTPTDIVENVKSSFSSPKTSLYLPPNQQDYVAWTPPLKRNKT